MMYKIYANVTIIRMYICLFVFTIFCFSCSKRTNQGINVGTETHSLEYEKISSLKENLFLFGNIESFDILNDEHFVVTTTKPSNIIIFDRDGNQIKQIGEIGRGPYEYQNPSLIRIHNNKIFVWDAGLLKLIVYDKLGNPIDEYSDFKFGIKDFKVIKNLVCFYFGGGFSGLVGVYDLMKKKYVFRGGKASEEHLLLNLNKGAGGLALFKDGLAYMSADQLSINFLNFSNYKEKTLVSLFDKDFKVENVRNSKSMINSNREKVVKYLMENSYVTGMFTTSSNVIIRVEVGEIKKINNVNDDSDRYQKFYVLNKSFELKQVIKSKHDFNENNKLFTTYNGEIYRIKLNSLNNNFIYILSKLKFKKND